MEQNKNFKCCGSVFIETLAVDANRFIYSMEGMAFLSNMVINGLFLTGTMST